MELSDRIYVMKDGAVVDVVIRDLTSIHPIAAGDMFGSKGVDHIAKPGMLARIIGGSYPSGPSNAAPPLVWQMILAEQVAAYNVPSGIVFDMLREGAAKRPGVLTKIGLDTFVDPLQDGCAMNATARAQPIVKHVDFAGEDWLHVPPLQPDVAIVPKVDQVSFSGRQAVAQGRTLPMSPSAA